MNPIKPAREGENVAGRAYLVWRGLIVFGLILAALAIVLSAVLYTRTDSAIDQNRSTLCAVGSFLTGAPLIRVQGVSRETFVGQLIATRSFLSDLQDLDCAGGGFGKAVTAEAIQRQLKAIRKQIRDNRQAERHQRGQAAARALLNGHPISSPSSGGSPATGSDVSSTPAAPTDTTPGCSASCVPEGGGTHQPSPPPTPTPAPTPTPTPTPTPQPDQPGALDGITHLVPGLQCHVNLLGHQVCS